MIPSFYNTCIISPTEYCLQPTPNTQCYSRIPSASKKPQGCKFFIAIFKLSNVPTLLKSNVYPQSEKYVLALLAIVTAGPSPTILYTALKVSSLLLFILRLLYFVFQNLYSQPKPPDGRGIFPSGKANFCRNSSVYFLTRHGGKGPGQTVT